MIVEGCACTTVLMHGLEYCQHLYSMCSTLLNPSEDLCSHKNIFSQCVFSQVESLGVHLL